MDRGSVGEILSRSHVFFSNAVALLDRGKLLESVMSLQRYADSLFYLASRMHASDCQEFFRLDWPSSFIAEFQSQVFRGFKFSVDQGCPEFFGSFF